MLKFLAVTDSLSDPTFTSLSSCICKTGVTGMPHPIPRCTAQMKTASPNSAKAKSMLTARARFNTHPHHARRRWACKQETSVRQLRSPACDQKRLEEGGGMFLNGTTAACVGSRRLMKLIQKASMQSAAEANETGINK